MKQLVAAVRSRDGVFATLGNHDEAAMVEALESLDINVLLNETVLIERGGRQIAITGLDDVHHFYTDRARDALLHAPNVFRVVAVHSPEIAELASDAGYSLYLTGHTHGGQIRVGTRPIVDNLYAGHAYASGLWQCGNMAGYTNSGAGVSSIPLRFNTRGELAVITLRSRNPDDFC